MKAVPVKPFSQASSDARNLYASAFPPAEQAPFPLLLANSARKRITFDAFYDEGAFCGLAYWFESGDLVYLLYLATSEKVRSKGYGGRILDSIRERTPGKAVVLEIETMDEADAKNRGQRTRRKTFYERNGFRDSGLRELDHGVTYDIMVSGRDVAVEDMRALQSSLWLGLHRPKVWAGKPAA